MLKNKKAIYILIPLNIFIWGFFVYRIYLAYNQFDAPHTVDKNNLSTSVIEKDSVCYQLKLNYKDPFLKNTIKAFVKQNYITQDVKLATQKTKNDNVKNANVVPKNAPDIKYMGLIKNTNSGKSAALVSINGQSRLVKQNELVEGILFKWFTKDSLVAKYGNDKIVVSK